MRLPVIRGVIDRRILVNFRVAPDVLGRFLPAPFQPKLIHGVGMAGICLIRLKQIRPTFLPSWLGITSENAAHRVAVTWDDGGQAREGVYIPRRDTNSLLNALAGGRVFPGVHHRARFTVSESPGLISIRVQSRDDGTTLAVSGRVAESLPTTSIFDSLSGASAFFEAGALGYSATSDRARFQGMELRCQTWSVEPLAIDCVESSFFADESRFPKGSVEYDCALLMRGIAHEWHGKPDLCCHTPAVKVSRG
jgi:hypothetical protein